MPKKAYLATHLSTEELARKYKKCQDPIESRRWHLLWKISSGKSIRESTEIVGLNYQYGKRIVKKYNELGEEGVKNRRKIAKKEVHTGGRERLLNEEELGELAKALKEKPADGGIWTGRKVARWIEKKTGREKVWEQRGWDYLKKLDYSWQRPRPKHRKGDSEAQREFKENRLPERMKEIQEKNPEKKVELWFFDEHRIGLKPILRKTWNKRGERPIAIVEPRYQWLYVYGFVEPKTGKTLWYLIPRVNTKWLNIVYEQFARDAGVGEEKLILLVEDQAGWHRSEKVEVPFGIEREHLPPYSPELQPAERLWVLVDEPLVNEHFKSIEEIEEILIKRCQVLMEQQEEIKNITNYHWLNYNC